ncbi:polymorphic toxin-type HINT domain-containing protein [Paenibacillus elgii]|uniref:polymorphic toxin-type HINT domain-containing protein n=1 Tax=Paenibacillus elgii TaxID=189691 RepID=UPI0019549230|nr:polymorphic toxin-type HINT domain-containing protein [Paenibacillus elgii]
MVLTKVRDAINNEINISYSETEVTLTQGDRTVRYEKQKDPKGNKELLTSVTDAMNRKTHYTYEIASASFDLVNSKRGENYAALLKQVQHPTQARTSYTYESVNRKVGDYGNEYVNRIKSREDIITYVNGTEEKYNHVDYSYAGDGAEVKKYDSSFATIVNNGRVKTVYSFDKVYIDENTPEVIYNTQISKEDGTTVNTDIMEYNRTKQWPSPIKVISKMTRAGAAAADKIVARNYDDYGNVLTETDPSNITTTYTYNPTTHWLETITKPINAGLSRFTKYVRNSQGSILEVSDREHNEGGALKAQINFDYDNYGNATKITLKDDNRNTVINKEYSSDYNYAFVTKQWSQVTDVDGNSSGVFQWQKYDKSTGNVTEYTGGNEYPIRYQYDKLGRLVLVTYLDSSQVKLIYDDANNKVTTIDPTGVTSFIQWNALGMKTSEGTVGSGTTSYGYDPYGRLSWSRDALSNATTYGYDAWNRIIRTTYPDGSASGVEYDDVNRTAATTDAEGNKTKETFDLLGRVTKKEWLKQTGTVLLSSNAYDFAGNVTSNVDGNNNTTSYAYDLFNRLVSVTNAKSETTKYSYNMAGKLVQTEYADGNKIQKQYDELGRLIRKIDALGQNERYYYDVNGNVKTYIDRKGQTTSYGYNIRDQLTSSVTGSETVSYEYDNAGRRTAMQDATGRTQYGYNNVGQLDAVTYPDGKKVLYVYDPQGNRTQMTDPFGYVTAYGYDNRNRLKGVGPAIADWDSSYDYKKNNLLSNVTQRNGIAWSYTFDGANLLNLTQTRYGAPVNSYGYTYDNNGNQTSKNENGQGNTFSYDKLDRIEKSSQFNEAYTYDSRSNRQMMQSSKSIDMSGADNRYDDRNRLVQVTTDDGKNVSYRYNGDGMLYERTENGQTTRYYYDGANMIAEGTVSNGTVTMKARYIRGGTGLVARQDAAGSKTYYLHNGHGDVVGLADGNGNVINRYTYDIWGNPLSTSEQVPQPFRYSGEFWDSSTNLQYLRARWYDPSVGRFINEDTYEGDINNPLSLNLYTYVYNNPLRYTDPSGHCVAGDEICTATYYFDSNNVRRIAGTNEIDYDFYKNWYTKTPQNFLKMTAKGNQAFRMAMADVVMRWNAEHTEEIALGMGLIDAASNMGSSWSKGANKTIGCNCFTAGTKVLTDEGEKNIEDIEVGDRVLAKDEKTGEVAYKKVTATFNHETDEIYKIHVGGQTIEATFNHPFWVKDKGWTYVKDLKVGDLLVQSDGNTLKVESIELEHKHVTVYNMTVDEFHTYFVSDLGIWVHNSNCPFGKFENADYHGETNNGVKNKAPNDGQTALDNSLSIGPNTDRRIGISDGEFVVLDRTSEGLYHGHVRSWGELTPTMQAILRKAGLVNKKGKIK